MLAEVERSQREPQHAGRWWIKELDGERAQAQ